MSRHALEIADIFRAHGTAWRQAEAGHLSLGQFKVMAAIERCRTAALGGHVAACGQTQRPSNRVQSASANGSSHRTSAHGPNQTAAAGATIPIEHGATEHGRPALSSPKVCPTSADPVRRTRLYPAGVRQPFTRGRHLSIEMALVPRSADNDP